MIFFTIWPISVVPKTSLSLFSDASSPFLTSLKILSSASISLRFGCLPFFRSIARSGSTRTSNFSPCVSSLAMTASSSFTIPENPPENLEKACSGWFPAQQGFYFLPFDYCERRVLFDEREFNGLNVKLLLFAEAFFKHVRAKQNGLFKGHFFLEILFQQFHCILFSFSDCNRIIFREGA